MITKKKSYCKTFYVCSIKILQFNKMKLILAVLNTMSSENTVKTLNIGTPRPATVVVLNIKQFCFTMK